MTPLKLLIEQPNFEIESVIVEESDKTKNFFIRGSTWLMSETKNKNGRIYKLDEMKKEVDRYTKEMIKTGRAIGELNHPTSVEINPERACHMVAEFTQNGNVFGGKSKILNTPMGNLVKCLLNDGVRLGVSSRALGKLTTNGDHNDVSEFRLIGVDVVHDPSVEKAFVDGVYESKEWILKCDGSVCEWTEAKYNDLKKNCSCLPKHNKDEYKLEQVKKFIDSLKRKD